MSRHINFKGGVAGTEAPSLFSKISSGTHSVLTAKSLLYVVAAVFFLLIGYYYYSYYIAPKLNPSFKSNNEMMPSNGSGSNEAEVLFFYANWCPHCKTAKPIWDEIQDEYKNKAINGYNIVFTEIDCTAETAETEKMMNQYKVEGFPTIKLLKDGQVIEFDAKPSRETLNQFLNTVL